jgi:hypothetical protein
LSLVPLRIYLTQYNYLQIRPLEASSEEFRKVADLVASSSCVIGADGKSKPTVEVANVYSGLRPFFLIFFSFLQANERILPCAVRRASESDDFAYEIQNKKLLFHGSRLQNWLVHESPFPSLSPRFVSVDM